MRIENFDYSDKEINGDDLPDIILKDFNLKNKDYALLFCQYEICSGSMWIGTKQEIKNILIDMIGSEEHSQTNSELILYHLGIRVSIKTVF